MSKILGEIFTNMEYMDEETLKDAQRELQNITIYKRANCYELTNINTNRIERIFEQIKHNFQLYIGSHNIDYLKIIIDKCLEIIYYDPCFEHINHIEFEYYLTLCKYICILSINSIQDIGNLMCTYDCINQINECLNELYYHQNQFVNQCLHSEDETVYEPDLYCYESLFTHADNIHNYEEQFVKMHSIV